MLTGYDGISIFRDDIPYSIFNLGRTVKKAFLTCCFGDIGEWKILSDACGEKVKIAANFSSFSMES
ncbi:hypothetical protein SDC9_76442 [bioreactor metagenome]|uniref:Uncharacterized protein n=1 Tax=bioreactor metagenome TaxID=1076179 RepID=A0A644YN83_9ZZZZ